MCARPLRRAIVQRDIGAPMINLADVLAQSGRTAIAHDSVCRVLVMRGEFDEAVTHCRRSIAIDSVALGPTHVRLVSSLELLAEAAMGAGSTAEAKNALQRAVAIAEANAVGRERVDELRAALPCGEQQRIETMDPPR